MMNSLKKRDQNEKKGSLLWDITARGWEDNTPYKTQKRVGQKGH